MGEASARLPLMLHVPFPAIITALSLPQFRLVSRPEAGNKSSLSGAEDETGPAARTARLRTPLPNAGVWLGAGSVSQSISCIRRAACQILLVYPHRARDPSQRITMRTGVEERG